MELIREALWWLDAAPIRYWTVAWTAFAVTTGFALLAARQSGNRPTHHVAFACAIVLTLFACRWPTFFYRADLNPDEAQIIAGAITLQSDPVVWRSVDTTTHGPLLEYGLVVAHQFGLPYNYVTARILAVLLQALALIATWGTLRRFTSESVARLGILPGLAFWSLVAWQDFVHYASSLPGIACLSLATWTLAALVTPPADRAPRLPLAWLTGVFAALVPFGKLQSAPHAAVLLLIGIGLISTLPTFRARRLVTIGWLAGGGLTVALLLALYLQTFGLWREFWITYVESAIAFLGTSAHSFAAMGGRFFHFSATAPLFAYFFWGNLLFAVLYFRLNKRDQSLHIARMLAWGLLAVAMFTVLRPGRESAHYLHLLVAPLTLLTGLTLATALQETSAWRAHLAFACLTLVPVFHERLATGSRFLGNSASHWQEPASPAAVYIRQHRGPGDTMAMWGWAPHLHVEVRMPHATREAQSGNQLMQWELTQFFVDRYVRDITTKRPRWFVDAVGPGAFIFDSRNTQGHESIPRLRSFIEQEYTLVAEFPPMRVYQRTDSPRP